MTDEDRLLSSEDIEAEEAVELPDREAMSVISTGQSPLLVPPTGDSYPLDPPPFMPTDPAR